MAIPYRSCGLKNATLKWVYNIRKTVKKQQPYNSIPPYYVPLFKWIFSLNADARNTPPHLRESDAT